MVAGFYHNCGRTGRDGRVACWGNNSHSESGVDGGGLVVRPAVVETEAGQPLTGVTQIDVGDHHSCARLRSGRIACWGMNSSFQLGPNAKARDQWSVPQLIDPPPR